MLALAVLFYAAWRTENRIVWLAFLVAYAIAAIAHHFSPGWRPRFNGARYVLAAGGVAIVVLAGFTAHFRAPPEDAGRILPLAGIEADLRPKIWTIALERIAEAPLLGHGYGREIVAPAFQGEMPQDGNRPELRHAHNAFLDVALQLGLAGEAIFLAILAILVLEFARALRQRESCPAGILGLAVIGGFVTKNLTDDFFYRQNGMVFCAVMGMLLGLTRLRAPR
jgi:O-antigen ligase